MFLETSTAATQSLDCCTSAQLLQPAPGSPEVGCTKISILGIQVCMHMGLCVHLGTCMHALAYVHRRACIYTGGAHACRPSSHAARSNISCPFLHSRMITLTHLSTCLFVRPSLLHVLSKQRFLLAGLTGLSKQGPTVSARCPHIVRL